MIRLCAIAAGLAALVAAPALAGPVAIEFSPDGKLIAVGYSEDEIRVYRKSGKLFRRLDLESGNTLMDISFSPNSKLLGTVQRSSSPTAMWMEIRNVKRKKATAAIELAYFNAPGSNRSTFIPKSSQVAAGRIDVAGRIWDYKSDEVRSFGSFGQSTVTATTDGKMIAYDIGPEIFISHVTDLSVVRSFEIASQSVGSGLSYGGGDSMLAVAAKDGVEIWSPRKPKLRRILKSPPYFTRAISFQPDGSRLAVMGEGGRIEIWNAGRGKRLWTLGGNEKRFDGDVALSHNGKFLAAVNEDGRVFLWNVDRKKRIRRFK